MDITTGCILKGRRHFSSPKMIVFAYDNNPLGINICDIMEETGQVAVVRWNKLIAIKQNTESNVLI